MSNLNRIRQVVLLKILYEYTDENHCMTIAQILQVLKEEYEIESYRKTIKEDIDLLIDAGFDIEFIKSSQNRYHIVSRQFDIAELKVLIDAVASARFISKEKSRAIIEKISKLAGPYISQELVCNIDVERRVKTDNTKLLLIVDIINSAINQNKQIAFKYFTYNVRKEKRERHNGFVYRVSPYRLVWNGDYYYVVGFSDKHQNIGSFRVDRISQAPVILDETAVPVPSSYDINAYLNSMFRMYDGKSEEIELICDNSVMDSIIDRFGENIEVLANDMKSFRIIINISVSHVFYGWIFGFGGKVSIKEPEYLRDEFAHMVASAMQSLGIKQ